MADVADGLEETALKCAEANTEATPIAVRFDVTREADVQSTFDAFAAQGIVLDLLFNNAGYQRDFRIASVPLRRYCSVDEVAAAVEFLLSEGASGFGGHRRP